MLQSKLTLYYLSESSVYISSSGQMEFTTVAHFFYWLANLSDKEILSSMLKMFSSFDNVPFWWVWASSVIKNPDHNFLTTHSPISLFHWHTCTLVFCPAPLLPLNLLRQCLWLKKGQMNSPKHPPIHFQSHHHHQYPYPTSTLLMLCLTIVITVIPTPKTSELQQLVHNTEPKIVCMCVCLSCSCQIWQAWSDSYGFQIFQIRLKLTMEHAGLDIWHELCVSGI